MKTRLELNLTLEVNKVIFAEYDFEKDSLVATKKAIAKKGLELVEEKWSGRSDYMEIFKAQYSDMLKRFVSNIYECYHENPQKEYVEVESVAKRKKKSGVMVKYVTSTGIQECEMQPYKTKVEAFKEFDLYVRKEGNKNWVITEAKTGFMLVESMSTKKFLEELLEMNAKNVELVKKKIEERIKSKGILNPHLVEVESVEPAEVEKVEFEPELTAISTNNSKEAEILKDKISPMDKMIDIQGVKINLNDKVVDVYNDEIAKVIELSQDENKVRIQYIGDENYLNGEILECSPNELEIIA